jgi:hypothetical protein
MTPPYKQPAKQHSIHRIISITGTILFGVMMLAVALLILVEGYGIVDDVLATISFTLIGTAAIGYGIAEII